MRFVTILILPLLAIAAPQALASDTARTGKMLWFRDKEDLPGKDQPAPLPDWRKISAQELVRPEEEGEPVEGDEGLKPRIFNNQEWPEDDVFYAKRLPDQAPMVEDSEGPMPSPMTPFHIRDDGRIEVWDPATQRYRIVE